MGRLTAVRVGTMLAAVIAMVMMVGVREVPAGAANSFTWVNKQNSTWNEFHVYPGPDQCMGVSGGSTASAAKIIQFDCNGNSDQFWYYGASRTAADGQTYWELRNVKSGKCLAVGNSGSTANGTNLVLWDCVGASDQFWRFPRHVYTFGVYWEIVDLRSQKCAGILNASAQRSTPVIQWDCNGNDDQQWK